MACPGKRKYVLPTFNVNVNIWRFGNATSNPPDVTCKGNLQPGQFTALNTLVNVNTSHFLVGGMWLLCPAGTDIRDTKAPAGLDTCEVPAGSGRFYLVRWVDDVGGGFPNEHRFALIQGSAPWPVPFPTVGGGAPPPPPPIPTPLGSFSTSGTPANSLSCIVTPPSAGVVIALYAVWSSPVLPTPTWGLSPISSIQGSSIIMADGLQFGCAVCCFPVPAGVGSFNLKLPGVATGFLAAQVFFSPFGTPTFGPLATSNGLATLPTLSGSYLTPAVPEILFIAAAGTGSPTPFTVSAPFNIPVSDIVQVVGGVSLRLGGIFYVPVSLGSYYPTFTSPVCDGWTLAAGGEY